MSKENFKEIKNTEIITLPLINEKDDPYRPDITNQFRNQKGRKVFGLVEENKKLVLATLSIAFVNKVPRDIEELDRRTNAKGRIVCIYSIWEY